MTPVSLSEKERTQFDQRNYDYRGPVFKDSTNCFVPMKKFGLVPLVKEPVRKRFFKFL